VWQEEREQTVGRQKGVQRKGARPLEMICWMDGQISGVPLRGTTSDKLGGRSLDVRYFPSAKGLNVSSPGVRPPPSLHFLCLW
jgi:hypothetical protein